MWEFFGFFDFVFLDFAAGCAAAGVAGDGFAAAGDTVNKNSAVATIAAPFRKFLKFALPGAGQTAPLSFILAPVRRGRNTNFPAHLHSITGRGRAEEDVKSTRQVWYL